MKAFKRVISTITALCCGLSITPFKSLAWDSIYQRSDTGASTIDDEALIPFEYDGDTDILEDRVIVVIKHSYSSLNQSWHVEDFGCANICNVEDLTHMDMTEEDEKSYLQKVTFHQILRITLKDTGIDQVLDAISYLEKQPFILHASPSCKMEACTTTCNDPMIPSNYYAFTNTHLYQAWDLETGSSSTKIGIIDSGIANVSDLMGNTNYSLGYDFYNNNTTTSDDSAGHGTVVASVAGAVGNNSTGVCGTCWDVDLVPLQVWGGGADPWIDAISYATSNNIPILNLSNSTGSSMATCLQYQIANYPGLIVCAAGNDGVDIDNNTPYFSYPMLLDNNNLIVVAASDANDAFTSSSNYGAVSVDLAAPGTNLWVVNNDGTYNTNGGTSLAAPMVAGTAALLLSYNPNLTALELKKAIMDSVDPISSMSGKTVSGGRLNAYNALCYVKKASQLQNIVVNVKASSNSGLTSFNTWFEHDYIFDPFYGYIAGSALPTPSGLTRTYYMGANNIKGEVLSYSGSAINSSGIVATYRFTSRFNQTAAVFNSFGSKGTSSYYLSLETVVIGDLNDDGFITQTDSNLLMQAVVGSITLTSTQRIAADMNFDGSIDILDSTRINQYINGTRNSFF